MDLEQSKALRGYLQKTLKLSSDFPELEETPEFYDAVDTRLKPHQKTLCDALQSAYPSEKNLQQLLKQEWGKDVDEIPHGESYAEKLRNTIEWMESEGYLLEFIAAAHKYKPRNARLNTFLRKTFITALDLPASPQLISSPVLPSQSSSPPTSDPSLRANNRSSEILSKGPLSDNITSIEKTSDEIPATEVEQGDRPLRPMPFPGKIISIDSLRDDTITSAYTRIRAARENLQAVYKVFQANEKISEPQVAELIEQARKSVGGISVLFVNIPTPDFLSLDYRCAAEEKYICERLSLLSAYALKEASINPSSVFQDMDRLFNKIFSGFQDLENIIAQFQEQLQLLDHVNDSLFGNSS